MPNVGLVRIAGLGDITPYVGPWLRTVLTATDNKRLLIP